MNDNENKLPTDDEINDVLKIFEKEFPPILSKLTGDKVPVKFNKNDTDNFKALLEYFKDYSDENEKIKKQNPSKQEAESKEKDLFDKMITEIFDLKKDEVGKISHIFNPKLSYEKLIPDNNYRKRIRTPIWNILSQIYNDGKGKQYKAFLDSIGEENIYASSQSAIRVQNKIRYLLKSRKRITRSIIEKYADDYKEISSFFEPLIIILYGLNQILKNKYQTYVNIKQKNTIGNLVNLLKNEPNFGDLLQPYDSKIRNAITHGTFFIDPLQQTIFFTDIEKRIHMKYSDFVNYVQEISKRAVIICHIESEFTFLLFYNYASLRTNNLDNEPF